MSQSKVGTVEAIMIVLITMVSHSVLSLTRNLIDSTQSSILLNLLFVGILSLVFIFLVIKLFKNFPGCDLLDITEFLGGKIIKNVIGIIFIAYFIITASILLRNFCEALKIVYYPMTNVLFLVIFFIIAISFANHLDFNATFKTNLIILPIALLSVIVLFFANVNNFSYERIFPILGNGFSETFIIGIGNIYAFAGIVFLYFLPPLLKQPEKFKKISIWSVVLSIFYLILCVSTIVFLYPVLIKNKEIMPLYSAARNINLGSFFQRLESAFLLIWILTFACYLSITIKFCIYLFQKITRIKDSKVLVYPFSMLVLGISMLPKDFAISDFIEDSVYPYMVLILVFGVAFLILLMANIKKHHKQQKNLQERKD